MRVLIGGVLFWVTLVAALANPLNNPYPTKDAHANTYYSSFSERPKTLDPARAYTSSASTFTQQIYEPPLQYHYLNRPYQIEPLTVTKIPEPVFYNNAGKILPKDAPAKDVAYSVYTLQVKPGIYYQPHPAFVRDEKGQLEYRGNLPEDFAQFASPADFPKQATRELVAEDYVYQIKRLADPRLNSPILSLMVDYIVGLKAYAKELNTVYSAGGDVSKAIKAHPILGVKTLNKYTYQIKLKGKYPQFIYWLTMPFFAPMPWEVVQFYEQEGMAEKNFSLDWYPVGTGAYMLSKNDPNSQMILEKNPNFHDEFYPTEGEQDDQDLGLLDDAGKKLPFIDRYVFSLEKESIPRWNKFLQGYYDQSGISSDSFDQAIKLDVNGHPDLSAELQQKDVKLTTHISPMVFYLGFNMRDAVVGGKSERARLLRQAIAIAVDYGEYIDIFLNGRGVQAQSPIPPGIFGYTSSHINPYIYNWHNDKAVRKGIAEAKVLLSKANYPDGRDAKTGKPLVLHYDAVGGSSSEDKARFAWMRKQFAKLGIQLVIRSTQYNRFQDKVRNGTVQIFTAGWAADYPDPENFLFLLYGPNAKVIHGGENSVNYENPEYDKLFEEMKSLPNGKARQKIIDKMLAILQKDTPWVWGFHPKGYYLSHAWLQNKKPHAISQNTLKYQKLDTQLRAKKRNAWNAAIWWPVWIIVLVFFIFVIPVVIWYYRKVYKPPQRNKD